jgi:N-acetylglucosamine malate deacetylase 2
VTVRACIIAAHPDDETIGASAVLCNCADVVVVHVTDGAPRDVRWLPADATNRHAYMTMREQEAERALGNIGAQRIALGFDDQEVVYDLAALTMVIASVLADVRPNVIVTHAYEGGHPDHDAVAVAVAKARARLRTSVQVFEMALYHGRNGMLNVGRFLDDDAQLRYRLRPHELASRHELLATYASQQHVLAPFFGIEHELYRPAREYDFTRPPHEGPLYYETLGMAPDPAVWRTLVRMHV